MRINRAGQASLVMVLLIGLVAMTAAIASSSLSVANVQVEETIHASDQAWYAAWAGVDELMLRLRSKQVFPPSFQLSLILDNGATVSAILSGDANQKTVQSSGYASGIVKNIEVKISYSMSKSSFIYAAQSGTGGFEMEQNTFIFGSGGSDGNVYSNGDVKGKSALTSIIWGNVWAVGSIGGLSSPSSGGVLVRKNAWASSLTACWVWGNVKSPIPPSNCPRGSYTLAEAPPSAPLISLDSEYWKNIAQSGGIWNGDCNVKSGDATDCTGGTGNLGNLKINGDLYVFNHKTMTFTGPVWVVGDIQFDNVVYVYTDDALGVNAPIIIASDPSNPDVKGRVVSGNNVFYYKNSSGVGPVLLSDNTGMDCINSPAIKLSNNTSTVVSVALNGCIYAGNGAFLSGVVGKKIHLGAGVLIWHDASLSYPILDPGSGGWAVNSIKEY